MNASGAIYLITLVVSVLSALTSFLVVILYFNYAAYKNPSRLLQIIISLIFADGAVGCCVLIWDVLNRLLDDVALETACRVMLPIPIMFFTAGYGFTVLVCLRFLQISQVIMCIISPGYYFMLCTAILCFVLCFLILITNTNPRSDFI
jgi:hypothetical protein